MKYTLAVLVFLIQLLGTTHVFGQENLFGIGGFVGVSFSQLPFENISNNEKTNHHNGLNAGIFCNADINKHYNLRMEILYNGNGAFIAPDTYPRLEYGKIRLNQSEISSHFDFYINSLESTDFLPDWTLEIGGAYSYLFSYYFEDNYGVDVSDQVKYNSRNCLLFQIGTTIYFANHFGGNIRYSLALPSDNDDFGFSATFRLIYRLY